MRATMGNWARSDREPREDNRLGALALGLAIAAASTGAVAAQQGNNAGAGGKDAFRFVEVEQPADRITYWVLPGPRVLERETFGTPEDPKGLFQPKLEAAMESKGPPAVPETLKKLPFMVGILEEERSVSSDGTYIFDKPTAFSNKARIISGEFRTTMKDVVHEDPPGPPGKTPDSADFEASFTDPSGNEYRVVLDHVVKPPFPGYQTRGGVFTQGYLHGTTGTGTPLMPKQYTHAAWWGLGELYINGDKVDDHRVMHLMTTEVVRDKDYNLAFSEDLPLAKDERHIREQDHHTHLMMPPIRGVPGQGPVFDPVPTAFELPNGKTQPFLHIMFEQDELSSHDMSES